MHSIYDDVRFFEGYKTIRQRPDNYNDMVEQPAMAHLLPPLAGKRVLELGCGYGRNSRDFIEKGAVAVVALDASARMLEVARAENAHLNIQYLHMGMEDIHTLQGSFDFVYSSLAVQYAADYDKLMRDIAALTAPGGILLFSQEHPTVTAPMGQPGWVKDENGIKTGGILSDYGRDGRRESHWIIDGVVKYHRQFSTLLNGLVQNGFALLQAAEPLPGAATLEAAPHLYDEYHRPTCLIIKAVRTSK